MPYSNTGSPYPLKLLQGVRAPQIKQSSTFITVCVQPTDRANTAYHLYHISTQRKLTLVYDGNLSTRAGLLPDLLPRRCLILSQNQWCYAHVCLWLIPTLRLLKQLWSASAAEAAAAPLGGSRGKGAAEGIITHDAPTLCIQPGSAAHVFCHMQNCRQTRDELYSKVTASNFLSLATEHLFPGKDGSG